MLNPNGGNTAMEIGRENNRKRRMSDEDDYSEEFRGKQHLIFKHSGLNISKIIKMISLI